MSPSQSEPACHLVRTPLYWLDDIKQIQSQVEINLVKIHHNLHVDMYAFAFMKNPHTVILYGTIYNQLSGPPHSLTPYSNVGI